MLILFYWYIYLSAGTPHYLPLPHIPTSIDEYWMDKLSCFRASSKHHPKMDINIKNLIYFLFKKMFLLQDITSK